MRALLAVLLGLLLATALPAQGQPKPDTHEQAADKALAAFKAEDEKALKALAERDEPDPWLVADELCFRKEHDAAEAFAKAAPRKDTEKMPAHVGSRRGQTPNTAGREALAAGDAKAALAAIDGVEARGADVVSVQIRFDRGMALSLLRDWPESTNAFLAAAAAAERVGWLARTASSLNNAGRTAWLMSDWRTSRAACERRLRIETQRGNRSGIAATLNNLGILHSRRGRPNDALRFYERARKGHQALGDLAGVAGTLINIGRVHESLWNYDKALAFYARGLTEATAVGHQAWVANALENIGGLQLRLGAYAKALRCYQQLLKTRMDLGDRHGVAVVLNGIGLIHRDLGDYAKAIAYVQRSLKLVEELGDRAGVAGALINIGLIHNDLGDYAKALAFYEKGLSEATAVDHREWAATAVGNIGLLYDELRDYPKALEFQQRALKMYEALGNRAEVARTLGNCGMTQSKLGKSARSLELAEQALLLARELGLVGIEVANLSNLSYVRLRFGRPGEAARAAKWGVEKLPLLVGRLAEEQGARARTRWRRLFENGVAAGMALRDPAEVFFFLESARAGALLESLGGRKALDHAVIPERLWREERASRATVRAAQARLRRALGAGTPKETREARADLNAAHEKVLDAVATIQLAAKAAANVAYPKAAPLEEIQAALASGDALVSYALLSKGAVALVVTKEETRIVSLGKTGEIEAALKASTRVTLRHSRGGDGSGPRGLSRREPAMGSLQGLGALRQKLILPLGLGPGTKRLLVSPTGELAYVPFVLLAEGQTVAYVPSGTTYGVLLEAAKKRGVGVLALGDPDYGTHRNSGSPSIYRSAERGRLSRLPATRAEARTVGDVVLLGRKATEAGFCEALPLRPRWRSVHLACHGLIDPARPLLSSLALSPDPESDGLLATLDVFRMKIPADLVVLSACETGKGRVYRAEGVVGFARAFMMAGTPRVIVSLWKVDDEATRALMVKFYELWNPKDGSKGLPTATALKKAQEFVASHEKWKRPYYWAAWQLWGVGD